MFDNPSLPVAPSTPAPVASSRSLLVPAPPRARVDAAIDAARGWLLGQQTADGYWQGELEGDTTLESYLILLETYFNRRSSAKVQDLARVVRAEALPSGGWAQYLGGPAELSVSCLSYFALKVAGDPAGAPHMRAARAAIRALGGVGRANTYTRQHLALFGQVPWDSVPAVPPEMLFFPKKAPFSVYDLSSWSRTIFVPLSIIWAKKPVVTLPPGCGVPELLEDAAALGQDRVPRRPDWKTAFGGLDRLLKLGEHVPGSRLLRRVAVARAGAWMIERLSDSDGLSAILPAMANSVLALSCLGYDERHPLVVEARRHLDDLLIGDETGLRMQPCISPVWDTVLSLHALLQSSEDRLQNPRTGSEPAAMRSDRPSPSSRDANDAPASAAAVARAVRWLLDKQTRKPGDWAVRNPVPPGGWYFERRNEFYPDVDDTCMALMVLAQAPGGDAARAQAVQRGLTWMMGMQNEDGGWASFDKGNDKEWLTHVPFADHNAMIDPSTADITGRVLESLSHYPGYGVHHPAVARALGFLRRDQATEGCWYGRWGVNYLYGTWQVLRGLRAIGEDMDAVYVRRAARWLLGRQNADGGWGESIGSYDHLSQKGVGDSTPSQTAWALMGLIAAGEAAHPAVRRGVAHLLDSQKDGTWEQALWTGTGFPKVFYLNYHYYRHYFPLMALGQYRRAVAQ
ncbi:MAG TPA: squalene--hopene cyclase [Polyangia bacterium]|nr:squalene--hopene cyclase [Polyangia bacterium]